MPPRGLSADVDHGAGGGNEVGLTNVMAGFLAFHNAADELNQRFVARAAPHQFGEVVIPDGEEAGADLAVGSDAHAAAVAAERMGNRSNDADLTDAVGEAVAERGFAGGTENLNQRLELGHARENFL